MKIPSRIKRVKLVSKRTANPADKGGFLSIERIEVVNEYKDGTKSAVYRYDSVSRKWLDAVALVLTADIDNCLSVCLRACIRPPVLIRKDAKASSGKELPTGVLWEVPAGLLEDGEDNEPGVKKRAAIEALEETGYAVPEDDFEILGEAPYFTPGTIPEKIHLVHAHLKNPKEKIPAQGDGSLAEDDEGLWWVPVQEALEMCRSGIIQDAKTELGLFRLSVLKS